MFSGSKEREDSAPGANGYRRRGEIDKSWEFLENDAILFEEFLNENDNNLVEAIKMYQLYKLHLNNNIKK